MTNEINVNTLTTVTECLELRDQAGSQGNRKLAEEASERIKIISIGNLKTQEQCENFIANIRKNGREDLVKLIHQKSIDLSVKAYPDYQNLSEVEIQCLKICTSQGIQNLVGFASDLVAIFRMPDNFEVGTSGQLFQTLRPSHTSTLSIDLDLMIESQPRSKAYQ